MRFFANDPHHRRITIRPEAVVYEHVRRNRIWNPVSTLLRRDAHFADLGLEKMGESAKTENYSLNLVYDWFHFRNSFLLACRFDDCTCPSPPFCFLRPIASQNI
jgi:hypothetical protein